MRFDATLVAMGLGALTMMPAPALSQQMRMLCAERDVVLTTLSSRYGEEVRGMGLAAHNRILEVHVSEETGSWTITLTSADGTTCLMAAGQHFEQVLPQPGGEDL